MDYFCVDVESSGPIPGIHNLLSVGVTHVRRFEGRYRRFEELYVELRPIFPGFEDAAMRVNGLDAIRLESEGLSPETAMARIVDWVNTHKKSNKKDRPVFVAHNAPFDWMFFTYYCGHADIENPFGFSALDTKPLAMGLLDIPWNATSLKNVKRYLYDYEEIDFDRMHHAGADASHLASVFCAMMNGQIKKPEKADG